MRLARRCAAPCPPRRALVPLTPGKPCVTKGKFTLLSYNLLADLYATVRTNAGLKSLFEVVCEARVGMVTGGVWRELLSSTACWPSCAPR